MLTSSFSGILLCVILTTLDRCLTKVAKNKEAVSKSHKPPRHQYTEFHKAISSIIRFVVLSVLALSGSSRSFETASFAVQLVLRFMHILLLHVWHTRLSACAADQTARAHRPGSAF